MTKLSIAVVAIVITSGASADLLYDLSPFDPELAFASDSVSDQFNNQRLAEVFTMCSPADIQRFKWWGRSEGAFFNDLRNMESFTMAVFADSGGLSGSELVSVTALTEDVNPVEVGTDPFGIPIWEFDFTMDSSLVVAPGNYWFSVGSDNFDPDGGGFYWQAAVPSVSNNFAAQVPVGDIWETSGFLTYRSKYTE
ncbi:MAG: hypothetical protein H0W86_06075 [Armatimonadetes bacterium]|nr:hypothetical protein [Armatimonadota bacterium]